MGERAILLAHQQAERQAKHRQAMKVIYLRLRAQGRCVTCRRPNKDPLGRQNCPECREAHNEYIRSRRAQLLARGRCLWCGRRPLQTQTMCADCAHEHRMRMWQKSQTKEVSP